jgi:lipoprotein-anchoring transpeptidase ErfK/SrfK
LWDDQAAPAGPLRIVVDLQAQRLYVYRGGIEIGRSSIAYGADDKPTPLGSFPILEKDADHVSNIYDAEMPYMLRLTWDGIAIHGSTVDDWAATNGCIGVPDEFAALLFRQAKLGDRVLVTKAWLRDVYEA